MTQYRMLRGELPKNFFAPNPMRFIAMFSLWIVGGSAIAAMVYVPMHWGVKALLALVIGHCWGVGGLVAHELMHGSIVRNRRVQNIFGFFNFLPFLISPTFWRYWHNNLHHSHTQRAIVDPDAYPTLRLFKQSRFAQWMYSITPGSGTKRSYLYLFFWFSINTQASQLYFRFRNSQFKKLDQRRVTVELAFAFALHGVYLYWVGPSLWIWAYVIPFFIQNYIPFSYISTNHNLSPLTKHNDPLENTVTVTNHPIWEFLHLNFGYHVEHHLFPTMCHSRHKTVHKLLKSKFPDKYVFMKKWDALKLLYKTPRIYKNSKTLIHPLTGDTFDVLTGRPQLATPATSPAAVTTQKARVSQTPQPPPEIDL